MKTYEKVQVINDNLKSQGYHDDVIRYFNEYTVNKLFTNPWEALKTIHFGTIDFTHDYFRLDSRYGNIETLSEEEIAEMYSELKKD